MRGKVRACAECEESWRGAAGAPTVCGGLRQRLPAAPGPTNHRGGHLQVGCRDHNEPSRRFHNHVEGLLLVEGQVMSVYDAGRRGSSGGRS